MKTTLQIILEEDFENIVHKSVSKAMKSVLDESLKDIRADILSLRGEQMYNVEQAAKRLNRSPFTVARWCKKGYIAASKHGGSYQIAHTTIEQYLKSNNTNNEE